MQRLRPSRLATLPLLAFLSACGGGGGGGGTSVSGTIVLPAGFNASSTAATAPGRAARTSPDPGPEPSCAFLQVRAPLSLDEALLTLTGELETCGALHAWRIDATRHPLVRIELTGDPDLVVLGTREREVVATAGGDGPTRSLLVPGERLLDVILTTPHAGAGYTLSITGAPEVGTPSPLARSEDPHTLELVERYLGACYPMVVGEVLVLEDDSAARSNARSDLCRSEGWSLAQRRPGDDLSIYSPRGAKPATALETARFAARLALETDVRAAAPNYVRQLQETPNDPFYSQQWHLDLIGLPEAWDRTVGSSSVTVAVLDSGIANHPDLTSRLSGDEWDFVDDDADAKDSDGDTNWHGLHVSGTVGMETNNSVGGAGVDWQARIMALRVGESEGVPDSASREALRYAAGLSNSSGTTPTVVADVINMSYGGPGFSGVLEDTIEAVVDAGVVPFAAAGNDGEEIVFYPAVYDGVVGVGAVRINSTITGYSNQGEWIDIAAPGRVIDPVPTRGVLSLWKSGNTFSYAWSEGTSMASPHAAGVAALLLSLQPSLTPRQVERALYTSATDRGAPAHDIAFGHGLINAARLTELATTGASFDTGVLAVGDGTVDFAAETEAVAVDLLAQGSASVIVDSVDIEWVEGGQDWLQWDLTPATSTNPINVSALQLTIDRTGLADGIHIAQVTVNSLEGNDAGVTVRAVQGDVGPGVPIDVALLATDTGQVEVLDVANSALQYLLDDVDSSAYWLVAAADLNSNGLLDAGDLIGALGSTTSLTALSVESSALEDIEIELVVYDPADDPADIATLARRLPSFQ